MNTILRIDASPRVHGSYTRELADYFEHNWLQTNPDDCFIARDLAKDTIPHLTEDAIMGFNTNPDFHNQKMKQETALSDLLINELIAADILLLSSPIYNFNVPSSLKAYIDHVVRLGRTFTLNRFNEHQGLVEGKQAYVITACGLCSEKQTNELYNYFYLYLQNILKFIGIKSIHLISLEGTKASPNTASKDRYDVHSLINMHIEDYHKRHPDNLKAG